MSDLSNRIANLTPEMRVRLEQRLLQRAAARASETAIPKRPTSEPVPLSYAQQRMWFLNQIQPDSPLYNIAWAARLTGALNLKALQTALDAIIARHEALRTTFADVGGTPSQVVHPAGTHQMSVIDLTDLPGADLEATRRLTAAAKEPFDLHHDTMMKADVVRLSPGESFLLLRWHHIAFDDWSMRILFQELATLYHGFSKGESSSLEELDIQYADFAVWQRAWLKGEILESQLSYWKRRLGGTLTVLELPTDRPRSAVSTHRGTIKSFVLPKPLMDSLLALSRQENCTLFMLLLAAYNVLLQRYTGKDDIIIGSPISGRNQVEIEGLIGFFVNTLALRADLSGQLSFRDLLARVRETCLEAYTHQDLPFERLVEELNPERDLSHSPLFQVMFVLQSQAEIELRLPGVEVTPIELDNGTAKFDLTLFLAEKPEGLKGLIEYDTDLFDAATIERMIGHLHALLEGIVADPDQQIGKLPLLTQSEQKQILIEWNNTTTDYPKDVCIHQLFEKQVELSPDAIAVTCGDKSLSYRELNDQANQLAHHLGKHGVGPDVLVGICMERSIMMVVGILGILKAGGAYLPLDPDYPVDRLRFMIEDAAAPVVITQVSLAKTLPNISNLCLDRDWATVAKESTSNPESKVTAESLAYVNYTSGSTGTPKAVEIPHRGVTRLLFGVRYAEFGPHRTFLQLSTVSFDASTFELWGALLHGGRCVLYPGRYPTADALGRVINEHRVDTLWLTGSLFNAIVDERPEILRNIKQLLIGGEALSVPHVKRALELLPATAIVNGYGPTEGTTFTCCYPIPRSLGDAQAAIPIGLPIGNTEVYILDGNQQPVPVGVPGELYIGGAGLARGYLHRPDLTREKFVPHPFSTRAGARLYRTGDMVRWHADGNLEFLGRTDDQVKIRGYRIEPGEIESVLAKHPYLKQAAVVIREDRPGKKRLVAYVVKTNGQEISAAVLRGYLQQLLPDYMVPQVFVFLDGLPLTTTGKVDKGSLPAPNGQKEADAEEHPEPRTPTEHKLARLWSELLHVDQVGIHDNFFDLGGHSLLAIRLFAKIETKFGKRLSPATLFQDGTVERLARLIDQGSSPGSAAPIAVIQEGTSGKPLFFVHAMTGEHFTCRPLIQHLNIDRPIYGLRLPETNGIAKGFPDLQMMARFHVESITSAQPEGPYYLAGYSYGGKVALEIAQQLVATGKQVALLAMIEAGPSPQPAQSLPEQCRRGYYFLRNLPFYVVDDLLQADLKEIFLGFRRKGARIKKRIIHLLKTGHYPTGKIDLEDICESHDYPELIWQVQEVNYRAWVEYEALPYPGRVTLFRSRSSPLFHSFEPDLGWTRLAKGGLEIKNIPGNHVSIMREPHVRQLADCFRASLVEAERSYSIRSSDSQAWGAN